MSTSYSEFILDISINDPELYEKQKKLHFHLQNILNMTENLAERMSIFLLREAKLPDDINDINDDYIKCIIDDERFIYALGNQLINDTETWYYAQPKFSITPYYGIDKSSSSVQNNDTNETSTSIFSSEHLEMFAVTMFDTNKHMNNYDDDSDSSQTGLLQENEHQEPLKNYETYEHIPCVLDSNQWWEVEDKGYKA